MRTSKPSAHGEETNSYFDRSTDEEREDAPSHSLTIATILSPACTAPDVLEYDPGTHRLQVATLEAPDMADQQAISAWQGEKIRDK